MAPAENSGPKSPSRRRPRGYRRDRDCRGCKSRDTKCDLNRPACGPCLAVGAVCPGYEAKIRWTAGSKQLQRGAAQYVARTGDRRRQGQPRGNTTQAALHTAGADDERSAQVEAAPLSPRQDDTSGVDASGASTPVVGSNWGTDYQGYLEYFTEKFNQAKTRRGGKDASGLQDYMSGIWQLARHRTMGGSSPSRDDEEQDERLALLHVSALRELNRALMQKDILALFGIVTLSFVDVCEGPFVDCQKHLAGAKALLELHCDGPARLRALCGDIPGFRQALSLLLWYDVMEAFLKARHGLVFGDSYRECMGDDIFHVVHCPRDTFELYVAIVRARTEPLLRGGNLYLPAMKQVLRAREADPDPGQHLHNAWRYSAAMAAMGLDAPARDPGARDAVELLADKLAGSIQAISPDMPQYRHLLGPVTVLRAESSSEAHHRVADAYWTTCETLVRPIYLKGREGCDEYWKLVLN